MALTQRLQMRQSQALVMTPQLMQAIKLLQLSNLDLAAYVEGELEKNPLLERAAEGEPGVIDGAAEPAVELGDQISARDQVGDGASVGRIDDSLETSRSAIEERLGTDLENEFPDEPGEARARADAPAPTDWSSVGNGGRETGDYNLEAFVSAAPTLARSLCPALARSPASLLPASVSCRTLCPISGTKTIASERLLRIPRLGRYRFWSSRSDCRRRSSVSDSIGGSSSSARCIKSLKRGVARFAKSRNQGSTAIVCSPALCTSLIMWS